MGNVYSILLLVFLVKNQKSPWHYQKRVNTTRVINSAAQQQVREHLPFMFQKHESQVSSLQLYNQRHKHEIWLRGSTVTEK